MNILKKNPASKNLHLGFKSALLGAISVALCGLTVQVSANDQDLVATTIPASACELSNSNQADMVYLSNGSWMFVGNNTGDVSFSCPLPLNAFTVADNTNSNAMTHFRIWYRDTDATGTATELTARLKRRNPNGSTLFGSLWNSNSVNYGGHTVRTHAYNHSLAASGQYHVYVTMARNDPDERPMFSGIDLRNNFIVLPPPVLTNRP